MGSVCIERRNSFFFSVLWQLTFPLLLSSNRISEFDELRWLWLCCTLFVFFLFPSIPRELDYLSSEITLQKYLNYFAEYITLFLLHLIDWIALIWTFDCWKLAVCTTTCDTAVALAHLSYLFLSFLSFLSFFCFTDHFRSLSPFVFAAAYYGRCVTSETCTFLPGCCVWGEEKPRALNFSLLGKSGTHKDNDRKDWGKQYTINLTKLSRWQWDSTFWWTRFSEGTLRTGWQNCSRFFLELLSVLCVYWTPGTCRGHTN